MKRKAKRPAGRPLLDRTGMRGISRDGLGMEVAAYRSASDIDVRFDDGSVREHVRYAAFASGRVRPPSGSPAAEAGARIGMRRANADGEMMEVAAVRGLRDLDVRFDDGTVREHVPWEAFSSGRVSPEPPPKAPKKAGRAGERAVNTKGKRMRVAAYRNAGDIDVEFEDGALREHVSYKAFRQGRVAHPDDTATAVAAARAGAKRRNNQGRMMEISAYRSARDMDVVFEDGAVREHVQFAAFAAGSVAHPADARGRGKRKKK